MMLASPPQHVLISGASGGLGGALARHYARPGVRLSLWGRDDMRLAAIAEVCRSAGAGVETRSIDLSDIDAALALLAADDAAETIDLAILAAGRGDVREIGDLVEDAGMVARLATINLTAPAAMAAALAGFMAERGRGNIVLIGSAASFHSLPFAAAYSGAKAGLARFADALRLGVRPHGVYVTLVSPGFIDTEAGRAVPGPKPMMLAPSVVAKRIAVAAAKGRPHVIMPWPFAVLRWLDMALPRWLRDRVLSGLKPPEA